MSQRLTPGTQRVATLHDLMVELGSIELKLERTQNGKPGLVELKARKTQLLTELDRLCS